MKLENDKLYSGNIDWNEVYRNIYPINEITNTIKEYLPKENIDHIVFSGFSEVAANLSALYPIKYVDYSKFMAERAVIEYPEIDEVIHADILNYLFRSNASIVCITCRISANWQGCRCIDKLIKGIKKYPRKMILIDFFDDFLFENKEEIKIGVPPNQCAWNIHERILEPSFIVINQLNVQHPSHQLIPSYHSTITSFDKEKITDYMQSQLYGYKVFVNEPLIPLDPSFSLSIYANSSQQ